MPIDPPQRPPTRVERFFDALLTRDGAGGSWLSALLRESPRGAERLGELAEAPGWLQATVAVRTETGRRGAFEQPAAPPRRLLRWLIDHPEQLSRPSAPETTPESSRLLRALLDDEPAGARARAQDRARELLRAGVPLGPAWWRLEEAHRCDCVLITDRLVVLVRDGDDDPPATPWLPRRSGHVRDLEATQRIAAGAPGTVAAKAWGVLTLAGEPAPDGEARGVTELVDAGAPHLDDDERAQLRDGDLGALSWERAARATGLDLGALPGF